MTQLVKNLPAMWREGFNPWDGETPGEGNGNPLQYSHLENPMDRGTWWATAHRVAQLDTTKAGIFPTQGSNLVFTS